MTKKISTIVLLAAVASTGCAADDAAGPMNGNAGGKADDVEGEELTCGDELKIELVGRDKDESSDGDQLTTA